MKKIFLVMAAAALFVSCKKEEKKAEGFIGSKTQFFSGKVWSGINLSKDGKPEQLSLVIEDAVLISAPGPDHHDHEANSVLVPLHPKAIENTPFRFLMIDWAASGHDPATVYDLPHFDIHFYMNTPAEVNNFTDNDKMNAHPASEYIPAMHVPGPAVPKMGKHWIDITSPEFNGQPFTQTFIYGSYDSKVVFYEPMITLDFLKNTTSFERPIPQPQKFQKAGYYPQTMKILKQNGQTHIILTDFMYRQAS